MNRVLSTLFLALLFPAVARAQDPYGVGAAGSGGITPRLSSGQAWMGNAAFDFDVSGALGGAPAVLGLSTQPASLFLGSTEILISLAPADAFYFAARVLGGAGAGAGSGSFPLPLTFPPSLALAGLQVFAQAVVFDGGAAGGLAATQGLRVEVTLPPLIFVGTSVAGSTDPHFFVDPIAQTLSSTAGISQTNNVTDAVFAHGGKALFVSKSLGDGLTRADLTGAAPAWSSFWSTAPGSCYGVGFDPRFDLVYTFSGPSGNSRELHALDADPASPTFGQVLASTAGATAGLGAERWGLSRSGNRAAIVGVVLTSGPLILVDTDPASPTYLQVLASPTIPAPPAAMILLGLEAAFTPNDEYVLVLLSGLGAQDIARYHVPSGTFVDHDPLTPGTIENVVLPGAVPTSMSVSRDGTFAVACGNGWAARVDFDPATPSSVIVTSYAPGPGLLDNAYGAAISPDGTAVALTSTNPAELVVLDAPAGSLLFQVALPGGANLYTVEWR